MKHLYIIAKSGENWTATLVQVDAETNKQLAVVKQIKKGSHTELMQNISDMVDVVNKNE